MFYADQHMHSSVSFDSHTTRIDMAEAAVNAGAMIVNPREATREDVVEILKAAW